MVRACAMRHRCALILQRERDDHWLSRYEKPDSLICICNACFFSLFPACSLKCSDHFGIAFVQQIQREMSYLKTFNPITDKSCISSSPLDRVQI